MLRYAQLMPHPRPHACRMLRGHRDIGNSCVDARMLVARPRSSHCESHWSCACTSGLLDEDISNASFSDVCVCVCVCVYVCVCVCVCVLCVCVCVCVWCGQKPPKKNGCWSACEPRFSHDDICHGAKCEHNPWRMSAVCRRLAGTPGGSFQYACQYAAIGMHVLTENLTALCSLHWLRSSISSLFPCRRVPGNQHQAQWQYLWCDMTDNLQDISKTMKILDVVCFKIIGSQQDRQMRRSSL